jgi:GT2 family glycosyltransferase
MNNDMEVDEPGWLEAMLEHIHRPGVAAVGARLVRPDGSLQHAGVIFKPSVFHCAMNLFIDEQFYTLTQRDVSGVTAACMLIRKSVFQAVGGFDEIHFPIGFSDADLCLKLTRAGHTIIYTPHARLIHHESATRKVQEESYEIYTLFRRYIGDTPMFDRHYKSMFIG